MARIEIRKRGPMGEIRLNRPAVLNAMGGDWPVDILAAANEIRIRILDDNPCVSSR